MLQFRTILFALLLPAATAHAEIATTRPYKPLTYQHETRDNPAQDIYVMSIDLTDPSVRIRVVRAGPDPDGDGPMHTTLMPPTQIATREGFDLVINGDFFSQPVGHDAEGVAAQRQFKTGNL